MTRTAGLPTVRTLDHVGLTVSDLDAATRFFVDVLGFQEMYAHRPASRRGDVQQRQFDRHPDTEIDGIVMLRLGTLNLELFQFRAPDQRREVPQMSDWGATHLALYVDDLEAAIEHLRGHGARVLGEPLNLPGPESGTGNRFIFVVLPGEIILELVTYPEGKAYESETEERLFDPRREEPWRAPG